MASMALDTSLAILFVTVVLSTHPLFFSTPSPTSSIFVSIVLAMTDPMAVKLSLDIFWVMTPTLQGEYTCSTWP